MAVSLSIFLLALAATPVRLVRSLRVAWMPGANSVTLAVGIGLLVFAGLLELLLSASGR